MPEGKSDGDNGKGPLSNEAWSWIMLLSGEIHKEEMKFYMPWSAGIAALIGFLCGVVAVGIAGFHVNRGVPKFSLFIILIILLVSAVIVFVIPLYHKDQIQKRLKPLIKIREAIISGELTDCNEIHGKWKDYIRRYYGKLLENTEMDKENKKLDEGKERPLLIRIGVLLLIALLIATLMLVAPPLTIIPFIASVLVLFVLACTLEVKLKKNNKDAVNQINDRFGDAIIGFISGLFASYFMWLLLTLNETPKDRLLLAVFTFTWVFVLFSIVVIWVFIEIKSSGTK